MFKRILSFIHLFKRYVLSDDPLSNDIISKSMYSKRKVFHSLEYFFGRKITIYLFLFHVQNLCWSKCCQNAIKTFLFSDILGKEEEARVHQHMHVVAQRQVRKNIFTNSFLNSQNYNYPYR